MLKEAGYTLQLLDGRLILFHPINRISSGIEQVAMQFNIVQVVVVDQWKFQISSGSHPARNNFV